MIKKNMIFVVSLHLESGYLLSFKIIKYWWK